MARPRINKGKHFRALVVSKYDLTRCLTDPSFKPAVKTVDERARHISTFLNRMKRNGYRVIVAFEVGSKKHADILSMKHRTFEKD